VSGRFAQAQALLEAPGDADLARLDDGAVLDHDRRFLWHHWVQANIRLYACGTIASRLR